MHVLDVDPAEAGAQEMRRAPTSSSVRTAKSAVPGFRRHRHHAAADAVEDGFAEPGAGGDERGVAAGGGPAGPQRVQFGGGEHRHGVGHRFEIVQQPDVGGTGHGGDFATAHAPRHVGHRRLVVEDRAGDAESDAIDRHAAMAGEVGVEQGRQAVEVERANRPRVDQPWPRRVVAEQSDQRLRPADVGRQDHRRHCSGRFSGPSWPSARPGRTLAR